MGIAAVVEAMIDTDAFTRIVNNPLAQFGEGRRNYLGATLLPEENRPENEYVEEALRFRTVIANDATRHSPVQKKGNALFASMRVGLGDSDIGSEFKGRDYDAMVRLIQRFTGAQGADAANPGDMQAIAAISDWADRTLVRPLMEKNEKQRWEAITNAQVVRTGDNGYREVVLYPNPPNIRVSAGGTWSDNAYDPWADLMLGLETMSQLGYQVNRIVTGTKVRGILSVNTNIKLRAGHLMANLSNSGLVQTINRGRVSKAVLDQMLEDDELPPLELYDLQYRTQTGSFPFLRRDALCMFATTDRDTEIDMADLQNLFERGQGVDTFSVPSTIGYTGVGRASGQSSPGRVVIVESFVNKPPRIQGEAWQTTLPVITETQAMYIITGIV
jgi:hypothetical protein